MGSHPSWEQKCFAVIGMDTSSVYMGGSWPVCGNTYETEEGDLLQGGRTIAIVLNVAKTPNECFEHTYWK